MDAHQKWVEACMNAWGNNMEHRREETEVYIGQRDSTQSKNWRYSSIEHFRIFSLRRSEKDNDGNKPEQTGALCENRSGRATLRREQLERKETRIVLSKERKATNRDATRDEESWGGSNAAYLLKGRTVEPEKQPLLAKGSETTFVFRKWLSKHVPVARDKHSTVEVLLETVFSTRSVQKGYTKDNLGNRVISAQDSMKKRNSWNRIGREPSSRENLSAEG
jgi:hypothetical protein